MAAASQSPARATSRYLEGAFAPVPEETTAFDLPVVGRVPQGLGQGDARGHRAIT
jgi:carotenoid cleavage dioxygenase